MDFRKTVHFHNGKSLICCGRIPAGIRPGSGRKPAGNSPESGRNPVGNRPDTGRNPAGIRPESGRNPAGIRPETDRNPAGIRPGSGRDPAGNQPESGRNPAGIRPESGRNPAESPFCRQRTVLDFADQKHVPFDLGSSIRLMAKSRNPGRISVLPPAYCFGFCRSETCEVKSDAAICKSC